MGLKGGGGVGIRVDSMNLSNEVGLDDLHVDCFW